MLLFVVSVLSLTPTHTANSSNVHPTEYAIGKNQNDKLYPIICRKQFSLGTGTRLPQRLLYEILMRRRYLIAAFFIPLD